MSMEVREASGSAIAEEVAGTETKTCRVTFLRSNSEPVTVEYEPE